MTEKRKHFLRLGKGDNPGPYVALFERMNIKATHSDLDREAPDPKRPVRVHFECTTKDLATILQVYPNAIVGPESRVVLS